MESEKTKLVTSITIHDTADDSIHWSSVIDASQISRRKALISRIVTKYLQPEIPFLALNKRRNNCYYISVPFIHVFAIHVLVDCSVPVIL